jgi:hypothetical protein
LNWFFAIALFLPFFATVFFNRNHTFLRLHTAAKLQSTHMLGLQLSFLQSQHISGCNHTVKDVTITCTSSKHQPSCNLTVSGLELFLNWFFAIALFYLFLQLFFFFFFAIAVTRCFLQLLFFAIAAH